LYPDILFFQALPGSSIYILLFFRLHRCKFFSVDSHPKYIKLGSPNGASQQALLWLPLQHDQPDAMTFAGRSPLLVVMLLSPVGKLPDSTVEKPPPLGAPLGLSAPAVCSIDGTEVSSPCSEETVGPVEAVAVTLRIEPPLWVEQGSGASTGTMARPVVVAAALAAALAAAAALASALAASLAHFCSAASFFRRCSSSSNSWGALWTPRFGRVRSRRRVSVC